MGQPFKLEDFSHLPQYHLYLRLVRDDIADTIISACALQLETVADTGITADKSLHESRKGYAALKNIAGEKMNEWSA